MGDMDGAASRRQSSADRKRDMARGGALLDHIPEMVTISDRQGRITYANPATERVSGYSPAEFASLHPSERIHPDDRSRCEEVFGKLLRTPGLSLELEHRARHKDGGWHWVEVTLQSLFDDQEVGGWGDYSRPCGT